MARQLTLSTLILILFLSAVSCSKNGNPKPADPVVTGAYFPPLTGSEWQTVTPASLNWSETGMNELYTYLESKNTKAFIMLKNGKIVSEEYFGNFKADSLWYWASAGKTMTALLVGIAGQEGLLNINNRTSQYLGTGWTSAPAAKENLITIKNQLTMTTGLDDAVPDDYCTRPECLIYKTDAGTRWAYHNAAYTLLDKVVEKASGLSYNSYFQQKIRDKIGMNGTWVKSADGNNIYYSNARSMARFGLLMLNKGQWGKTPVLNDSVYFNSQINTSQNFNLSYGYLTWLNGKATYMLPTLQAVFTGPLVLNAPADLYAALGKNDQKIYVVPSQNLVVIRMGNSAGQSKLAVSSFDNELWGKLKAVIRY